MNIAVIGAGALGLSAAIELLDRKHSVTILARDVSPKTTSDVAAAFWFPFHVLPANRALCWGRDTFRRLEAFCGDERAGVWMTPLELCFEVRQEDPWWLEAAGKCERDIATIYGDEHYDRFRFTVPLIDTSIHMPYLVDEFRKRGGELECRELKSLTEIPSRFDAAVCCPGVWAAHLLDDAKSHPVRGQVIRIERPPGLPMQVFACLGEQQVSYVVVRSNDCILGGTAQAGDWNLEPVEETAATILRRTAGFRPAVENPKILNHLVGLRPGRDEVRLEREKLTDGRPVVYNYGHGGAGYTLNWGCATEVAELLEEM